MRTLCLGLLALFANIVCADWAFAAESKSPNILLIVSDDQAWTDYGFMGHPHVHTPHLDRLAQQSLTFRRGYVPSSLCCPSLATIITGLYPHQHRVTSNDPPRSESVAPKDFYRSEAFREGREAMNRHLEEVPTLPRLLAPKGYLSFQTGKWWQGNFKRGGFTHGMTRGDRHGDEGLDIGRKTLQPVYDFIATARKEEKPFFVWYAPMMPHDPHTPPQRLLDKYLPLTDSPHIARYWAMIEWFDETIGELLAHLDEQGLARDTIVVFTADNGWIQSPDNPRYAPKSKQSQYDGGLRSPIMIRWPGHVAPRMSDELAMSIDIVPTLLAAAGLPRTPQMQGINVLDESAVKARKEIFGECFTHNAVSLDDPAQNLRWRWTVAGKWKLIVPDGRNEPNGQIELYDLTADPHETDNLAAKEPEVVAKLRLALDKWWEPAKGKDKG